jgi:cation diffusion facilitator CzcD-associated flavoprotein CzcO
VTDALQASPVAAEAGGVHVDTVDVIVIGAGVSGLCQLFKLREAGLSVRCLEAGGGVGGTWYWNRYPGCSFDAPSQAYCFSFAEELASEWDWKHFFSFQPDTEEYLNLLADTFGLRSLIQFDARVKAATWDEDEDAWEVETEGGERLRASFLLPSVGVFGLTFTPPFEGVGRFRGETYHTGQWPREEPDLAGKRVAIIGTGASAVQLAPKVAEQCAQLTVFQRTPTYCLPSNNGPVDPETQRQWKETYGEIQRTMRDVGILVTPDPRRGRDVPREERLALYEEKWTLRGADKFVALFHDLFYDREILAEYSEWLAGKIREQIDDPALAEKLVPHDHLFQAKRVPLEDGYYTMFNRDNVSLVDVRETPIECLTEQGIRTSDREHAFDVVVFATGFDNVTGAVTSIDIRGVGGRTLKEKWEENGLSTYLGVATKGFPNLFLCSIPALGASHPPGAEYLAEWFRDCILYMRGRGYTRVEPRQEAEDAWMEHHDEMGRNAVFGEAEFSWYTGANVPGKQRRYLLYCNSVPNWHHKCTAVAEEGYKGFDLTGLHTGMAVFI